MTSVLGAASAITTGSGDAGCVEVSGVVSGAPASGSGADSAGKENGLNEGAAVTRGAAGFGTGLAARGGGGGEAGATGGSGTDSRRANNGGGARSASGALIQCPDNISACAMSESTNAAEKMPNRDGCFTA